MNGWIWLDWSFPTPNLKIFRLYEDGQHHGDNKPGKAGGAAGCGETFPPTRSESKWLRWRHIGSDSAMSRQEIVNAVACDVRHCQLYKSDVQCRRGTYWPSVAARWQFLMSHPHSMHYIFFYAEKYFYLFQLYFKSPNFYLDNRSFNNWPFFFLRTNRRQRAPNLKVEHCLVRVWLLYIVFWGISLVIVSRPIEIENYPVKYEIKT